MVGAGRLASLELSLAGSRHPCYPWPRPPCRPAAAPHRPDQKSISHHGQAAAGERAREPPELSIQSRDTFYTQEKFCLTTDCRGACVWCGWWHCPWSLLAAAGSCALLQPRVRGAGRRGAAASCGPGGWRQERRGDQKYLSGEMARDGDGGAAGTLHQDSVHHSTTDTDYITHFLQFRINGE